MISLRRAILAIAVFLTAPAGVWWLALHDKLPAAAILLGLTLVYVACEVAAESRANRAAWRRYWAAEHAGAGPLTGYTPQVEDRLWRDFDRSHGGAA